jgi:hypothetical protein
MAGPTLKLTGALSLLAYVVAAAALGRKPRR